MATLTAPRTAHVGTIRAAVDVLTDRERLATRNLTSVMAWHTDLTAEIQRRMSVPSDGKLRTLQMVDWPDGPRIVRTALRVWDALPGRLDRLVGDHWPDESDIGARTAARLLLLALRCDRDNDLRSRWIDRIGDAPPHGKALLADRTEAIASGTQWYATITRGGPHGLVPAFPVRDTDRLDGRRAMLGLPAAADDHGRCISDIAILRHLGRAAGSGATHRVPAPDLELVVD